MTEYELNIALGEARKLIYKDREKLDDFDINIEGTLNYVVYHEWLLPRKELRDSHSDLEFTNKMLHVFNDAYYICTILLMHPRSSRRNIWCKKQVEYPSLVMPLVHLYLSNLASARRELGDLLKIIEGDCDCYSDWKENFKKLKEAVKGFSNRLPAETFTRRDFTPEFLKSLRWWSITKTFEAEEVGKCICFNAMNLDEQKMMAKVIYDALSEFEFENGDNFAIDDNGSLIEIKYDFSKTYQLCKDIMDSNKYSHLINNLANLEDIIPVYYETKTIPRGRPKMNPEDIKASFQIVQSLNYRNERLDLFFGQLKGKYIYGKTDKKIFIDMFMGVPPERKIVWIKALCELRYLFKTLNDSKFIDIKPKCGIWQAVCSCFQIMKNETLKHDNNKTRKEIREIRPEQFSKGKTLQNPKELDNIIVFLDPKFNPMDALTPQIGPTEGVGEMFGEYEMWEQRHKDGA